MLMEVNAPRRLELPGTVFSLNFDYDSADPQEVSQKRKAEEIWLLLGSCHHLDLWSAKSMSQRWFIL